MRRGESSPSSTPSGGRCDLGMDVSSSDLSIRFLFWARGKGGARWGVFLFFVHIPTVGHRHFLITRNTAGIQFCDETQRARVRVCA
jgi:hypothetical protein